VPYVSFDFPCWREVVVFAKLINLPFIPFGRGVNTPAPGGGVFGSVRIDNLLVRIHFIIEMIWWTGLAPWEFEFPFPGSE